MLLTGSGFRIHFDIISGLEVRCWRLVLSRHNEGKERTETNMSIVVVSVSREGVMVVVLRG